MITRLLRSRPSPEAELFAEAQSLLDDGVDLAFVLSLYPDDAEWLEPLLATSATLVTGYAAEEPSYYFEASLKSKFMAAGSVEERPLAAAPPAFATTGGSLVARLQTTMAAAIVVLALGSLGVLTLGFVTADQALPGDWNYAFKRAGEQIEYTLSRGDTRVNVQLQQAHERVQEFQRLSQKGQVSSGAVEDLRKELEHVQEIASQGSLDDVQAASVRAVGQAAEAVLSGIAQQQPDLAPAIEEALPIAAGLGGVTTLEPETPTPTPEPTEEATPEVTVTGTPEPAETPVETETPAATTEPAEETATPSPATETPDAAESPTPRTTVPIDEP